MSTPAPAPGPQQTGSSESTGQQTTTPPAPYVVERGSGTSVVWPNPKQS